jgi:subtilisin family serine protease
MGLQNLETADRLAMKHHFKIWVLLAAFLYPMAWAFAAPCPDLNIQVKGDLVSIHVKEQPLKCIIDQLGQLMGVDIKLWQNIQKPMTLNLTNLSLETIFHKLGTNNALVYAYLPEKKEYRIIAVNLVKSQPLVPQKVTPNIIDGPFSQTHPKKDIKPEELLIRFKDHVSRDQMHELHQFLGSRVLKQIDQLNLHRIKIAPHLTLDKAIQMYKATGIVRTAEYHGIRYLQTSLPNDPGFSQQWGLTAIKATDAWTINSGSTDVVIAVIDTGVYFQHPDLGQNIWINQIEANGKNGEDDNDNLKYPDDIYGWDCANDDNLPFDTNSSHGTHVAGIIGAVTNNSMGVAGACPKVRLMVLKVQKDGKYDMETMDIIEAIVYAQKMGAHIINCSFGGGSFSQSEYDALEQFQNANNGLIVCAAGNASNETNYKPVDTDITPLYPAGYDLPGIISVAASKKTAPGEYALADFSFFGATRVDVMAPGDDIYSTIPGTNVTQSHVTIGSGPTPYPAEEMEFAAFTDAQGITASLVDCGYGHPDEIPLSVNNNIALIQRGNRDGDPFFFHQKITNVQQKGAIGAIIYNNIEYPDDELDDLSWTLLTPGDWIPVISVSQETGLVLKTHQLASVTLVNQILDDITLYGKIDGTSMAAGFVSGAAGLLRAHAPRETFTRLKQILIDNIDTIDSTRGKLVAEGQLNIVKALKALALPGDVNKDFNLTLEDSIVSLKILSGKSLDDLSGNISHWDVNNDDRLELPEPIHTLQKKGQ